MAVVTILFCCLSAHASAVPKEWLPVPGVGFLPQECIHTVESGSHVWEETTASGSVLRVDSPSGASRVIPRCAALDEMREVGDLTPISGPNDYVYHSWMVWTNYTVEAGVTQFLGTFSAPEPPSQSPQILYSFTGLQNNNWIPGQEPYGPKWKPFDIIQPVLAYAGGYSVQSWYVTLDYGVVNSNPLDLQPGASIFGNMTQTGETTWYIGSTVHGQTTEIHVTRDRLKVQPWSYTTIECYGCEGCDYVPTGPQYFTAMSLKGPNGEPVTPDWEAQHPSRDIDVCNGTATIQSAQAVTYTWGLN